MQTYLKAFEKMFVLTHKRNLTENYKDTHSPIILPEEVKTSDWQK